MSEKPKVKKHIRCVPGDPARAERIADHMDTKKLVAQNREYTIFTVTKNAVDISVCSTDISSSLTVIALEELIRVGAHIFIRVGSSGGRQPHISIGST